MNILTFSKFHCMASFITFECHSYLFHAILCRYKDSFSTSCILLPDCLSLPLKHVITVEAFLGLCRLGQIMRTNIFKFVEKLDP